MVDFLMRGSEGNVPSSGQSRMTVAGRKFGWDMRRGSVAGRIAVATRAAGWLEIVQTQLTLLQPLHGRPQVSEAWELKFFRYSHCVISKIKSASFELT
jgi:hypothetical protein